MMSKLTYYLTYACMWLLAQLPFGVLFVLSDVLAFLAHRVVRYRLKVVRTNLKRSFPEKSADELKKIERDFYQYLCDYLVAEVKMLTISEEEMFKRFNYTNKAYFHEMLVKYGGVILLIPHYGYFEWIISLATILDEGGVAAQVYKPLHNKNLDEMFKRIRSRFGGYNIPKHSTAKEMIKLYRAKKHFILGLITDQSPNINEAHYWTTFLNQDTVFMDGGERLAKMMGLPVFYADLKRTSRGYYEVYFELITETPKSMKDGEITEQFARKLEQTIHRDPPYWFWSHRRWKLTREMVANHGKAKENG